MGCKDLHPKPFLFGGNHKWDSSLCTASNPAAFTDLGNIPDVWIEALEYFWVTANSLWQGAASFHDPEGISSHRWEYLFNRIFVSWSLSPKNNSVNQKWFLRGSVKWPQQGSVMATHGHVISKRNRIFRWYFGTRAHFLKTIPWWNSRGIGVYNVDSGLYFRKHSVAC